MDSLNELEVKRKKMLKEVETLNKKESEVNMMIGCLIDDFTDLIKENNVNSNLTNTEYFAVAKRCLEKHFLNIDFRVKDSNIYKHCLELIYLTHKSKIKDDILMIKVMNR